MPLYEYECSSCGHRFEVIQRFSDAPIEKCTKCLTGDVHKLLSAPAFQFKGTGWYVTDYPSKNRGGPSAAESKSTAKSESSSDSSSSSSTASSSSTESVSKPAADTSSSSKDSGSSSKSDQK